MLPSPATVRRALRVARRDWRGLAQAQWTLLATQWRVWSRPTGALLQSTASRSTTPAADDLQLATALGRLSSLASTYGLFRPSCLVRSLALQKTLDAHGLEGSVVRVGVRSVDDRKMAAHAWLEYGPLTIGESRTGTRAYVELAAVRWIERL